MAHCIHDAHHPRTATQSRPLRIRFPYPLRTVPYGSRGGRPEGMGSGQASKGRVLKMQEAFTPGFLLWRSA